MVAEVRKSVEDDVFIIAENMRRADKLEIALASGKHPKQSLLDGFIESEQCFSVVLDGEPIGMFGVRKYSILGQAGSVWFLGTDKMKLVKKSFVKHSKFYVENFFAVGVEMIENYVWVKNRISIRWLKWLGFIFEEPKPYGLKKKMFMRFYMRRK